MVGVHGRVDSAGRGTHALGDVAHRPGQVVHRVDSVLGTLRMLAHRASSAVGRVEGCVDLCALPAG